jgi:hypothetical protein
MLLTERYSNDIHGVLTCYDRILIHGNIAGWCFADGMTGFLNSKGIRIFDFPKFAEPLNEGVRQNAEKIAKENGIEIEFIRKTGAFRKDDKLAEIIEKRGSHPGLVHIFSAMEGCNTYKPWHAKESGKTFLKFDTSKCLHYYFYFIDKEYGLCYMRVPTWAPFRLQFYMNGHNLLENKLKKNGIEYTMIENAFHEISDFNKAQELSDKIRVEDLHQALDAIASRYCPIPEEYAVSYNWSIMQVEYAMDICFKKQEVLQTMYNQIIKTAVHTVDPDNIASFLGKRFSLLFEGEAGSKYNKRILGTRIKHQMGEVSVKMYDKAGIILRIECTSNDVSQFKQVRDVAQRDGTTVQKTAPVKKSIYSLFVLSNIFKGVVKRYLEYVSEFDDPSDGIKKLDKVTKDVRKDDRNYKGFNFFSSEDQQVFEAIARGEFNIRGMQNKNLRSLLSDKSTAAISRVIKRLRTHGLIKKVKNSYRYYLTALGKSTIVAGLKIKNMLLTSEFSSFSTVEA